MMMDPTSLMALMGGSAPLGSGMSFLGQPGLLGMGAPQPTQFRQDPFAAQPPAMGSGMHGLMPQATPQAGGFDLQGLLGAASMLPQQEEEPMPMPQAPAPRLGGMAYSPISQGVGFARFARG